MKFNEIIGAVVLGILVYTVIIVDQIHSTVTILQDVIEEQAKIIALEGTEYVIDNYSEEALDLFEQTKDSLKDRLKDRLNLK